MGTAAAVGAVVARERGQNIFWKEATKGHYSDDGDERQKKKRRKKFYREHNAKRRPRCDPLSLMREGKKKKTFSN